MVLPRAALAQPAKEPARQVSAMMAKSFATMAEGGVF